MTYSRTPAGLIWDKQTGQGVVPIQLTNFSAEIVGDIVRDDGSGEIERRFEIEAEINGKARRFTIPASQFAPMNWATEHLGALALIYPGQTTKDHARAAIQTLSTGIAERLVFTHTGWRDLGGEWVYLHAGGAIGQAGPVSGIEVSLDSSLGRFELPDPPVGHDLTRAVRASLSVLDVAPRRIAFPLLTAVYRAAMRTCDFTLHLSGPTGAGKTALAVLGQQHFGASMSAENLPGSWSSTGNALEVLAFTAKDALFVVDDFAPHGGQADIQKQHAAADRLLRAQGNGSGRHRMRSDGTLRAARPPRGLVLSTGEDTPKGQSLRARVLVLELGPEDVSFPLLAKRQQEGSAGLYAASLAGFVRWFASRRRQFAADYRREMERLREDAFKSGQHRRTPGVVADLAIGLRYFLAYARDTGAVDEAEEKDLWGQGWGAFGEVAGAQAAHQAAGEPARRFLELLSSALASGQAHVAACQGGEPKDPKAWGWRLDRSGIGYAPQGMRIGWIDGDDLYLEPTASFAAAQRMGQPVGDQLAVTPQTLRKRLEEKGLLVTTGKQAERRDTLLVRRPLEGGRKNVLHLHRDALISATEPDQPDQGRPAKSDGQVSGQDWSGARSGSSIPTDRKNGHGGTQQTTAASSGSSPGSLGQVGQVSSTGKGHLAEEGRQGAPSWSDADENLTTGLTESLTFEVIE